MLKKAGLYPKVSSRKLIEEGPYTEAHAMNYNLLFKPIATRSGRFEIYSNELAEDCYYNLKSQWYQNQHVCPLPVYVHIAEPHGDEEFYLVCGKATWHQKNSTRHDGYLMEYGLEGGCPYTRIYVNADRARKLGIDDGDLVEVECIGPREKDDACVLDEAVVGVKETVRVKVTEGLHPEAAWVYFGGGHRSNSMLTKGREGIVHNWFVPSTASPYAGGVGKNYSIVKIRKLLNLRN